jgi:hypothetical protein
LYDFELEMPDGSRKMFNGQTRAQALALGVPTELLDQLDMQYAVRERAIYPNMYLN